MLVYTNKTVDRDWLCIYILMQNWKFSHFQKQGNVRKIESYYIHLNNIDRHLKLVAACKKKKQLEIFFFF